MYTPFSTGRNDGRRGTKLVRVHTTYSVYILAVPGMDGVFFCVGGKRRNMDVLLVGSETEYGNDNAPCT